MMMQASGAWSVVSAVVLGILLLAKLLTSSKYGKNLPPGPRGLPIIGSLHLLGKFPPRGLTKLAETYGPLMSVWLGPRLVVVANSPAAAEEILKTQGSNFANRMATSFGDMILPGDIILTSDSPMRLHLKKILHVQLSTHKQLQLATNVRTKEITDVICAIPQDGVSEVSVKSHIEVAITNIMSHIIFKRHFMALASWKKHDDQEHEQDAFAASVNTTTDTIEWAIAECIRNPVVMKKVQTELHIVVGKSRRVEDADVPNLKYLQAVVKENFRLHLVIPLLLPHVSKEPCKVLGYDIPEKTPVFVNVGAIARDPRIWEDPKTFKPERFLDGMPHANMEIEGNNFELLPFGAGWRQCPGIKLASTLIHIIVANFMQSFDWSLPNGLEHMNLDMSEGEGVTHVLAHPLIAIPKARLSIP